MLSRQHLVQILQSLDRPVRRIPQWQVQILTISRILRVGNMHLHLRLQPSLHSKYPLIWLHHLCHRHPKRRLQLGKDMLAWPPLVPRIRQETASIWVWTLPGPRLHHSQLPASFHPLLWSTLLQSPFGSRRHLRASKPVHVCAFWISIAAYCRYTAFAHFS